MDLVKNNKYEILTPDGWCDFDGVKLSGKKELYKIKSGNDIVTATKEHIFFVSGSKKQVNQLSIGDIIDGTKEHIHYINFDRIDDVYDIINVNNEKHNFIVNDSFHSKNCDEFAFVRKTIAEDFWSANYPTISSSVDAKIIIISTPCGMWNLFHKIYTEAEHCENTFVPLKFTWRDVPGRDKEWADEQRKNLGKVKFAQEQLVEFLGSTNTVIDPNVLEILINGIDEPETTDLGGKLLIYEKPRDDCKYVIGTDTAKGTGENYSVAQILRIESLTPLKFVHVAKFESNTIDVYSFADVINRLSYYYNNAFIMCENNSEGSTVVNRIWWEHENPNLINSGSKTTDLGIRATKTTKPKAVLLMKKLLEDGDLVIKDRETIKQLSSFVDDNGKYRGRDTNDDCVSALYWAIYIVEMNILEHYNINALEEKAKNNDEAAEVWGILSDASAPEEDFQWLYDRNFF